MDPHDDDDLDMQDAAPQQPSQPPQTGAAIPPASQSQDGLSLGTAGSFGSASQHGGPTTATATTGASASGRPAAAAAASSLSSDSGSIAVPAYPAATAAVGVGASSSMPAASSSPLRFASDMSSPAPPVRTAALAGGYPAASSPFGLTSDVPLPTSPGRARSGPSVGGLAGLAARSVLPARPPVPQPRRQQAVEPDSQLFTGLSSGGNEPLFTTGTQGSQQSRSAGGRSVAGTPRSTGRTRGDIYTSNALERFLERRSPSAAGAAGAARRQPPAPGGRNSVNLAAMDSDMSDTILPTGGLVPPSDPAMGGLGTELDPAETQKLIWGTTINIEKSMGMFRDFILNFTKAQWLAATRSDVPVMDADRLPFYPQLLDDLRKREKDTLNLDCTKLKAFDPEHRLYDQLVRYPQEIIPLMDHTLTDIFFEMFDDVQVGGKFESLRVRPFNIKRSVNLRELDPADIDQLVTVKGLLIRTSPILPDLKQAFFRCTSCDTSVQVDNDRGQIREPVSCPSADCKMKNSMRLIHNRCLFSDKQVSRLQETPDQTPDGQTPYTVSMASYDELVDVCKPGDRMEITGIFRGVPVRVNPRRRAVKALFKTYIDMVHIKRLDDRRVGVDKSVVADSEFVVEYDEGDEILVGRGASVGVGATATAAAGAVRGLDSSEADTAAANDDEYADMVALGARPDLYDVLSRSIAPSIFGMEDVKKGVLLQLFGGTHKFTGATDRRASVVAPRGVYTSGKGSSAVGLTAYVTRDPETRQLVLESGALVLSDGGVCCIDEFDKMSEYTRSVLHEAGIITTLNARTSILACANPIHSKFDPALSVPENVNLPPPLMSRFDLMYLILDKPNERDDRRLAQHLVSLYLTHVFAKYINYARRVVQPVISEEAGQALVNFYVSMRRSGSSAAGSNVITFTTRQLESMIRLSEAHAKMRLSPVVERVDVEEANRLVLTALQTAAIDPRTGRIDLDLVTTGISAFGRQTALSWVEAYRALLGQSDQHVSETEFNGILRDLVDENFVHVSGRSNADKVIRKLRAIEMTQPSEKHVLVLVANGNEEMEVVITVDILRRAGLHVTVASVEPSLAITCSRGIALSADDSFQHVEHRALADVYAAVVVPGGMKGAETLTAHSGVRRLIDHITSTPRDAHTGTILAAICAAPIALAGAWAGATVTSHPSVEKRLTDAGYAYREERVVWDGRLLTSRGPGTAFEFALALDLSF
ncbi:MCM2/3/5 family-domain-containing protein [Entophlyctis helioformis]|nr:MCM2/3/5 family-domain-containing protein [Entophlyctis helioformis]